MRVAVWRSFCVVSLVTIVSLCSAGQQTDFRRQFDRVVHDYVIHDQFSGVVLVAKDNTVLFEQSYGFANLEWRVPNSLTTRFQIASLTKQFTAAATFLLQDQGKLNVNDPIKKYMPDAPAAWDHITIYNLLTHTSGIPDSYDGIASWAQTKTPAELVAAFRNKPLDFEPGTARKYSNAGYYLLGYLIEKISGTSYEEYVQENIFKPLGMKDSGYDSNSQIIQQRASGYHMGPSGPVRGQYYDVSLRFSAGGLYSTVGDLWRWEQGLFNGHLLSAASLKTMTAPYKDDFACGLVVDKIDGHSAIEHSGEMDGFTSDLVYFPQGNLTVVVLNNLSGETQSIASKLAAVVHGEKVTLPSEQKDVSVPADILKKYVGTYSDLIPGYNLVVTYEGDHLTAQVLGPGGQKQSKYILTAESPTTFFQKKFETEYQFISNSKGEVVEVLANSAGHTRRAIRR